MGKIYAQDTWKGQPTRIHVRYNYPDPDWENDPDIADALARMRDGGRHRIQGQYYYTTDPSINQYDIVIARRSP